MADRDLSLAKRLEDVREKQAIVSVVSFSLSQIKDHFNSSVASIEEQFSVADSLLESGKADACKEIWRSQVVFIESALDFYIHELSKYAVFQMFKGSWAKTPKYNSFLVPMSVVEDGIKNPESTEWFKDFLNTRFSREVYLAHEPMKDQINMLGLNFGVILETAFPKSEEGEECYRSGKTIIIELFTRRNQIAHQADRVHATAERNDIEKAYVEQCIADVRALVLALHNAAVSKDTTQ